MRRRLVIIRWAGAYLAALLFAQVVSAAPSKVDAGAVTAQAYYVVDYTNRKVLFSKNARMKFFPASTVKLMTALVVLDRKDLKDRVVISSKAVNVEPTRAGLTRGASYSVEDLLEVLLATSANDAGVALAESVAGTESAFAALMNEKAKAIGMKDSHFANATGLPDSRQVVSAYDMAILVRAAFSHSFVKRAMAERSVTIRGSDGKKITRSNHNKLLWRLDVPKVLGKTGYTRTARHCYAGIAYYEDRRVSLVILKSRKPWADIYALLGVRQKAKR
jgi:D-alanyl-D-alanine carboxypeptidase